MLLCIHFCGGMQVDFKHLKSLRYLHQWQWICTMFSKNWSNFMINSCIVTAEKIRWFDFEKSIHFLLSTAYSSSGSHGVLECKPTSIGLEEGIHPGQFANPLQDAHTIPFNSIKHSENNLLQDHAKQVYTYENKILFLKLCLYSITRSHGHPRSLKTLHFMK